MILDDLSNTSPVAVDRIRELGGGDADRVPPRDLRDTDAFDAIFASADIDSEMCRDPWNWQRQIPTATPDRAGRPLASAGAAGGDGQGDAEGGQLAVGDPGQVLAAVDAAHCCDEAL